MDNAIKRHRSRSQRYVDPLYAVACLIFAVMVAQVAADALFDRAERCSIQSNC